MRVFWKAVIVLVALLVAGSLAWYGLDRRETWATVPQNQAADRIFDFLANCQSERLEVERDVRSFGVASANLREELSRIESRAQEIRSSTRGLQRELDAMEPALADHRAMIARGEPATIGGRTYSLEELEKRAARLQSEVRQRKAAWRENRVSLQLLERKAEPLHEQLANQKSRVEELEARLAELREDLETLDALHERAELTSSDTQAILEEFAPLRERIIEQIEFLRVAAKGGLESDDDDVVVEDPEEASDDVGPADGSP